MIASAATDVPRAIPCACTNMGCCRGTHCRGTGCNLGDTTTSATQMEWPDQIPEAPEPPTPIDKPWERERAQAFREAARQSIPFREAKRPRQSNVRRHRRHRGRTR